MQPRPSCKLIHVRTSGVVLDEISSSGQPSWFSSSLYTYKYGNGKLIPSLKTTVKLLESKVETEISHKPEEIYDFAQWAFSADGLLSLEVLAYGDFSYEGRYSKFNLLFCRSASGYKTLTHSDILPWNLVQDNMEMLASCPLDDILE